MVYISHKSKNAPKLLNIPKEVKEKNPVRSELWPACAPLEEEDQLPTRVLVEGWRFSREREMGMPAFVREEDRLNWLRERDSKGSIRPLKRRGRKPKKDKKNELIKGNTESNIKNLTDETLIEKHMKEHSTEFSIRRTTDKNKKWEEFWSNEEGYRPTCDCDTCNIHKKPWMQYQCIMRPW